MKKTSVQSVFCGLLTISSSLYTIQAFATTPSPGSGSNSTYNLVDKYALGGAGKWDYLADDDQRGHLFVSHGDQVDVVDTHTGKVVGSIANTLGVHGIALAQDLGLGFTSNGKSNNVTVFDLNTLAIKSNINVTGQGPDAILYEPKAKQIWTFNGHSSNATVIDALTLQVVDTVTLPGHPEFAVTDGEGKIFDNLEDKNSMAVINAISRKVTDTWSLAKCDSPSGLALDRTHHRLLSVCDNNIMTVVNSKSGHVLQTLPIGARPDAAAFDPETNLAFSSNGDGTLTIAKTDQSGHFTVIHNIMTQKSARTLALDLSTHRLYLSAATYGSTPVATVDQPKPRPTVLPDSFLVLVLAPSDK